MWPSARGIAVGLLGLAACGRVNFESRAPATSSDGGDGALDADPRLPGLIAWYPMEDDFSTGTIRDRSGGDHHAMCGASCPTSVAGRIGNAAAFDGTRCGRAVYGAWLETPSAYSFSAWIYLDQEIDQVAFGKPFGSGDLDAISVVAWTPANGPGLCMESVDVNANNQPVCGPTAPVGRWIHVAGRWTGQAKALFVDGQKVGDRDPAAVAMADAHDFLIGCDENAGTAALHWYGKVDELQLYDRALTDPEIQMLATAI